MKFTLGMYGVFLLLVAIQGNAKALATDLEADLPHYLPWLVVAAVMGALYDYPATHNFAALFILLIILAFTLGNYTNIETQAKTIYDNAVGTSGLASTVPNLAGSGSL